MSFVPLHLKSHHSIGLGTASISTLVQYAGRAGFTALALTDLENLRGQIEFQVCCHAYGVHPIAGVELRRGFDPGRSLGEQAGRILLLASDAQSYARLCQIVTQRRSAGRISPEPLASVPAVCEGIYLLSDDPEVLDALVAQLGSRWVRALLLRPGPESLERELVARSRRLGLRWVADLDASLLEARDAQLQALLGAIHRGVALQDRTEAGEGRALLELASAERLFEDLPEAIRESEAIAEACTLNLLTRPAPRTGEAAVIRFEAAGREALRALGRSEDPRYAARLSQELAAIRALGLVELFDAVAALIREARRRSIPIAARGSVVSSLVGHVLGFSPVDPLEHGLYFERFASAARRRPPDIDLDVASRGREQLVDWLLQRQGPSGAARLGAHQGFGRRSALRDGLKALGVAPQDIDDCLRSLPPPELGEDFEAMAGQPRWPRGMEGAQPLVQRLIGKPRQVALHPGGVVLGPPEQLALIPLELSASGVRVSQYDARSVAALGLCKVDLLGNRCLDEIDDASSAAIPNDDPTTLSRIAAAQTIGCHQLESPALRAVLASMPIRSLRDITHALAIVRPGPASGSAKEAFLARARGEAPAAEVPSELAPRLNQSYGMLLYEEDITFVLSTLAGLPLATAEALRVRLVERSEDSDWLARVGQRLRARARERGFDPQQVRSLWSDVLRLGRYSFSRAHSASQALLAYRTAFLSCHAPLEFGCATLNHHGGSYPRRVIASDLARRGIELRLPSVLRGLAGCEVERDPDGKGAIRIGLGLLKGVRAETRRALLAWRQVAGAAPSLGELLAAVALPRRELEALLWSGAFDEIIGVRSGDYPWVHEALWGEWSRGRLSFQRALAGARRRHPTDPPQLVARYSGLRRVQHELRYLEMHISDHPMRLLRKEADRMGCVASERLSQFVDRDVHFAGIVAATRNVAVAERGAVQFITLEDEYGLVEARLAPDEWQRFHPLLSTPGPFLLRATVRRRLGALHLQILELLPFHERGHHLPVSACGAATGLD